MDTTDTHIASVGAVEIRTRLLDGGYYVRCVACLHPHRVTDEAGACVACGRPLAGAPRTTEATYRASRADDAPIPYTAD